MTGTMYKQWGGWLPHRRIPRVLLDNPKLIVIDLRYTTTGPNNSFPLRDVRGAVWLVVPTILNGVLQCLPPHTFGVYAVMRVRLGQLELCVLNPGDTIATYMTAAALGSFSILDIPAPRRHSS